MRIAVGVSLMICLSLVSNVEAGCKCEKGNEYGGGGRSSGFLERDFGGDSFRSVVIEPRSTVMAVRTGPLLYPRAYLGTLDLGGDIDVSSRAFALERSRSMDTRALDIDGFIKIIQVIKALKKEVSASADEPSGSTEDLASIKKELKTMNETLKKLEKRVAVLEESNR